MFKNAKVVGVEVDSTDYHKNKLPRGDKGFVMSSSALRAFGEVPSKWAEPIVDEDGNVTYYEFAGSKSTEWGNLFDCVLLTPQHFDRRYVLYPETYTVTENTCPSCGSVGKGKRCNACKCERREEETDKPWSAKSGDCQKWKADREAEGKICISKQDRFKVDQAVKRFRRDDILNRYVECCQKQVHITAEWHDEETGLIVPVQCLIDLAPKVDSEFEKSIGDVKTCRSAKIKAWESWCLAAGYDVQAAWNTDLFVAATNREILNFCFLLSENVAPWEPGRRWMSQDIADPAQDMGSIASGRRQYRKLMALYCKCLAKGHWPGYDDHADATQGWTLVTPNPYKEMARDNDPAVVFDGEEPDPEAEPMGDDIPA